MLLTFGGVGALGFVTFQRNQKMLRPEFVGPRIAFAVSAPILFVIFRALLVTVLFPTILREKVPLERVFAYIDASLIALLAGLYFGVVIATFRWPLRMTAVAPWFVIGVGCLGVVAKVLALVFRR